MKKVTAYGVFGKVDLNVEDAIAREIVIPSTLSKPMEVIRVPDSSFSSMDELYDTAELRGHSITGFIASSVYGVGFYTIN